MLTLYSYFRSSAAYRVRIGLNMKKVTYEVIPIHLVKEGGEQFSEAYRFTNPQCLVPALKEEGCTLNQSLAILEYLDETYKEPPLLPKENLDRAYVRGIAQMIVSDIHPLNNLRVLTYLKNQLNMTDDQKNDWYRHWVDVGFTAIETIIQQRGLVGKYCFKDQITLADLCLIPQIYNAKRFHIPLTSFPTLVEIYENCMTLPAFQEAAPEAQSDFQ